MKKITILCGHYGSGKTTIALNLAKQKSMAGGCTLVDLDIVNPYFKASDHASLLGGLGIKLIASQYSGSNLDVPALPSSMMSVTDQPTPSVIDVGGDDRGAVALGRLRDSLIRSGDYEMLFVYNSARPLSRTAQDGLEIMYEIERACGLKFSGIINSTNLSSETTASVVLAGASEAEKLAQLSGVQVVGHAVIPSLIDELSGQLDNIIMIDKLNYEI